MVRYDDFDDYHGYHEYAQDKIMADIADIEYPDCGQKTGYQKIKLNYEYDECIYSRLSVTHYEDDDDDDDYDDAGGDDDDNVHPPQC